MPSFDTKFVFLFGRGSAILPNGKDGWRCYCTLPGWWVHFADVGESDGYQDIGFSKKKGLFSV